MSRDGEIEIQLQMMKPKVCEKCGEINPIQEMINTIHCLVEGCGGMMVCLTELKMEDES